MKPPGNKILSNFPHLSATVKPLPLFCKLKQELFYQYPAKTSNIDFSTLEPKNVKLDRQMHFKNQECLQSSFLYNHSVDENRITCFIAMFLHDLSYIVKLDEYLFYYILHYSQYQCLSHSA